MINESNIIFFGKDNHCMKYEYGNCYYHLTHFIKYPYDITITIEITYKNSLNRRKYNFFKRDIPKKHMSILSELIEYYESSIIVTKVLNEGFGYDNWFKKVLEKYDR